MQNAQKTEYQGPERRRNPQGCPEHALNALEVQSILKWLFLLALLVFAGMVLIAFGHKIPFLDLVLHSSGAWDVWEHITS